MKKLKLTLELLSDAIFATGHSAPGGDDITVAKDSRGLPYVKGSSMKGLFRQALENLLDWKKCEDEQEILDALLGSPGWRYEVDRRLAFTNLVLNSEPDGPLFSRRAFTALENGITKAGALRSAECIRAGVIFTGNVFCADEDVPLVTDACRAVKYAGTLRHRGFGRVRVTAAPEVFESPAVEAGTGSWLRFELISLSPLLITDQNSSDENNIVSRRYIPGSAVRGMLLSRLAKEEPAFFERNRLALLKHTHFLSAYPVKGDTPVLPSPKGFYADKAETSLRSVFQGDLQPGDKRAKLGDFCTLSCEQGSAKIMYWSAETERVSRIHIAEKTLFSVDALSAGQTFVGYIKVESNEIALSLQRLLTGDVFIGADKFQGFGHCKVCCRMVEQPDYFAYMDCSGSSTLYILAMSPFNMLDSRMEPTGLHLPSLAALLGVDSVALETCSTTLAEYGSFNRTWGCRSPAVLMYEPGSLFKLRCSSAPSREKLLKLETTGLGFRTEEGFGQILFIDPVKLFKNTVKQKYMSAKEYERQHSAVAERRARIDWIQQKSAALRRTGLSSSQKGDIYTWIVQAIAKQETDDLCKKLSAAKQRQNIPLLINGYQTMIDIVESVLANHFDLVGCNTQEDRLLLLRDLFLYHQRT